MEGKMRKTLFMLTLALCVAAVASVASSIAKNSKNQPAPETIVGFLMDQKCSSNKAMIGNEECAQRCIKNGSPAVLATEDGKVYGLDPQDKVVEFAGHRVKITGSVSGSSISVTSIERE
jgi:hypothetical protein